jgi:hypothetical protein
MSHRQRRHWECLEVRTDVVEYYARCQERPLQQSCLYSIGGWFVRPRFHRKIMNRYERKVVSAAWEPHWLMFVFEIIQFIF